MANRSCDLNQKLPKIIPAGVEDLAQDHLITGLISTKNSRE